MTLTLDQAQSVLDSAIAIARERGARVAIAVVDDYATPVALARLDGVRPHVPHVALGKAMASAVWGRNSSDLVDKETISSPRQTINNLHGGLLVYASGAVPLMRDGIVVGAVGVAGGGGGPGDEEIATQAAETFAKTI
jgi:uncharacterized protein GlcG (DUF336 family)